MTETADYQRACKEAATVQGLDEIAECLRQNAIQFSIDQAGGYCMVINVPSEGDSWIGITNEGDPAYIVCRYADAEDMDGTVIGEGLDSLDAVLSLLKSPSTSEREG